MTRTSEFRKLYNEVVAAYWKYQGEEPGPSAYLSALWEEASIEMLKNELHNWSKVVKS
jgi:hypothetical protein